MSSHHLIDRSKSAVVVGALLALGLSACLPADAQAPFAPINSPGGQPAQIAHLLGMLISPRTAQAGNPVALRLVLNRPAGAGGVDILLSSDTTHALILPKHILIPAGVKSLTLNLPTRSVKQSCSVTLKGADCSSTRQTKLIVVPQGELSK